MSRLQYYRRVLGAYVVPGKSQLTFWHDRPEINPNGSVSEVGEYYMPFVEKAGYAVHDADGIPLLDYHGQIGLQYNPIAIAQWGLGNFNLLRRTGDQERKRNSWRLPTGCVQTSGAKLYSAFRSGTIYSIGSTALR